MSAPNSNAVFVTFDVFETLLVRPTATGEGMFALLAGNLQSRGILEDGSAAAHKFAIERKAADRKVWSQTLGCCELSMVYESLASEYGWNSAQIKHAVELEIEMEVMECRVIPSTHALLLEARASGYKIGFISDTYLHANELRKILAARKLINEGDQIFASADFGVTKSSGKLYRSVRQHMAGEWLVHYGNDRHSDLRMAQKNGINARCLDAGNLSAREKTALMHFQLNNLGDLGERLVGAARIARLMSEKSPAKEVAERKQILASVACPLLATYAIWLCQQLQGSGLERVYFLSRDGYIPKLFYDRMQGFGGLPRSDYLFASRAAWHPGTLDGEASYYESWLFDSPDYLTSELIAKRMGLTGTALERFMSLLFRSGFDAERILEGDGILKLRKLLRSGEGENIRQACASDHRSITLDYLAQQGCGPRENYAIVDLGWNGRLQRSLSIIRQESVSLGLYLGLKASASSTEMGPARAFLFDERVEIGRAGSHGLIGNCIQVMESFCIAPHASVKGYQRKELVTEPIFTQPILGEQNGWEYVDLGGVFEEFLDAAKLSILDWNLDALKLRTVCAGILRDFVLNPSEKEVRVWGQFPFVSDQAGGVVFELGRPLPPANLRNICAAIMGEIPYGPTAVWRIAARRRTPKTRMFFYATLSAPIKCILRMIAIIRERAPVSNRRPSTKISL